MAKDHRQLGLFVQPEVEVSFRSGRLIVRYNKPHSVSIPLRDRASIRYEALRLVKARMGTRSEVARKFKIHPDTLTDHLARYRKKGIQGLIDRPPGPRPGQRLARYRHLVIKTHAKHPEWSAIQIHQSLPPRTLSLKAIRRILKGLREG